jgi:hypothetical protein
MAGANKAIAPKCFEQFATLDSKELSQRNWTRVSLGSVEVEQSLSSSVCLSALKP